MYEKYPAKASGERIFSFLAKVKGNEKYTNDIKMRRQQWQQHTYEEFTKIFTYFFLKKVIQREEKIEEKKPKLKGESPSKKIPQKTTSLFFSASFRNRGNIRDFELLPGRFVLNIFVLCSSQLQILRLESQRRGTENEDRRRAVGSRRKKR